MSQQSVREAINTALVCPECLGMGAHTKCNGTGSLFRDFTYADVRCAAKILFGEKAGVTRIGRGSFQVWILCGPGTPAIEKYCGVDLVAAMVQAKSETIR